VVRDTDECDMNRDEANNTVDRSIQIEPTRMICTMGLGCMIHVTILRGEAETWHVTTATSHHIVAVVYLLLLAPSRNQQ
jgi:hypothetical protein